METNIEKVEKGKLKDIFGFIANRFNIEPDYLRAVLITNFPELKDKSTCANCGASMEISLYSPDILDALLLLKIAEEVRNRMKKGMSFTEANLVHVPTLLTTDGIRHRTTRCSYLNYIKQPKEVSNTGNWLITQWGWKALRGEPVPKTVRYFRGKLIDRGEETITLSGMFQIHRDKVQEAIARRKKVRSDYVAEVKDYNPSEWAEFDGVVTGQLI